jgi:hypothetical protein
MAITKLEAGKTYKLINKTGWIAASKLNEFMYSEYFINDEVTIETIDGHGDGYVGDSMCISDYEYEYFEEVKGLTFEYYVQSIIYEDEQQDIVGGIETAGPYYSYEEASKALTEECEKPGEEEVLYNILVEACG